MILKKHKNSLLNTIKESGLDLKLFSAEDGIIDEEKFFIIQLRNSPLRFAVNPWKEVFTTFGYRYSHFRSGFPLSQRCYSPSPQDLHENFEQWLNNVVTPYLDEISTPDLWQTLEDSFSATTRKLETPDESEPFSDEEKIQLRLSIKEFRISIVNYLNPPKEYQDTIDSHFKDLSDAIDKQSKFTFRLMAIQLVVTIAIDLALNPEQFNQLFQLLKNVFSQISYLLP